MALYDKASLVLIPSGTKTGTVYSQKPTDGDGDFTFTRSTQATRVNSQGLIEKERGNLLLQSNNFDTTWSAQQTTTPTNGFLGYDGSNDAWKLKGGAGFPNIQQSLSQSGVQTLSVYTKKGEVDHIRLLIITSGGNPEARFDLSSGIVVYTTGGLLNSDIESVGNGWYRCSLTANGTGTSYRIYAMVDSSTFATSENGIYIQDAQLEQGLVATDYIETTTAAVYTGITDNVPRLDYDGDCPSLLLEPQRQNLIDNSEYFNVWQNGGGTQTIVANATTSPEGLQNASSIQIDSGYVYRNVGSLSISSGDKYTWSCYVNSSSQKITFGGGTVGGTDVYSSEDVGNGWYRQKLTRTFTTSGSVIQPMFLDSISGTDLFYIYGAQVEEGSYATSYIPTYGTSVTRNGDICNNAGDSTVFNDSEGVLYAEMLKKQDDNDNFILISINNADANSDANSVTIGFDNEDDFYFRVKSPSGGYTRSVDLANANQYYKMALKYKSGDNSVWVNGVKVAEDNTNFSFTETLDNLSFDYNGNGVLPFYGGVRALHYFPEALTDTELADLTT